MYRQIAEWTSSLFSVNNSYIRPKVIIEVSGRSMSEPVQTVSLHSYIDDVFKNTPFTELDFTVRAVVPERTFLEKLFLLHEEYHKPSADVRTSRMSRHLYDICQIMETPISERALNDKILYLSVMEHRGGLYRSSRLRLFNFVAANAEHYTSLRNYGKMETGLP